MLELRWLGVAGWEFSLDGRVVLVDPYLTRVPFINSFVGKLRPNRELLERYVPRADFILVSHAHHDHLMDVPAIMERTGASAWGSPNTVGIIRAHGLPAGRAGLVEPGQELVLGPFTVKVFGSRHVRVPFFGPGPLRPRLNPPLSALDFRMDGTFAYRIRAADRTLLVGYVPDAAETARADILFLTPFISDRSLAGLLSAVRPRTLVFNHWDDFFRPLGKPLKPGFLAPRIGIPPVRRADLLAFTRRVAELAPAVRCVIPELFRTYSMGELPDGRS